MCTCWGGRGLRAESSFGVYGYLCVLLWGYQGGEFSVMVRLHFSLVLGLQGRRGELGAPSPRSCVLGGMQMCTLTSWEASCTNQGRMEPCGAAADESCWSWSGRRGGFLRRQRGKCCPLSQGDHVLPGTALWSWHDAILITPPFSLRCLVLADECVVTL